MSSIEPCFFLILLRDWGVKAADHCRTMTAAGHSHTIRAANEQTSLYPTCSGLHRDLLVQAPVREQSERHSPLARQNTPIPCVRSLPRASTIGPVPPFHFTAGRLHRSISSSSRLIDRGRGGLTRGPGPELALASVAPSLTPVNVTGVAS